MKKRKVVVIIFIALVVCMVLFTGLKRLDDFLLDSKLEASYDALILQKATQFGVEPELVKAVIWKESRFRMDRIGDKGEIGLMQLMPLAVTDWCRRTRRGKPTALELAAPELNIEIGTWYLAWCGSCFPGRTTDVDIVRLAVYNAGYGRVKDKWLPKEAGVAMKLEDITFPSTQAYIARIFARRDRYRERGCFRKAPSGDGAVKTE